MFGALLRIVLPSRQTGLEAALEIVLALISALLFALGSVLQQKAGMDAPSEGTDSGLLLRMARRPVWLIGITSDALGFVAQAAALRIGHLAVVQPLLVTSVVIALPLGVWLSGHRAHRTELASAALVVTALIVFLAVAPPSGGRSEAPIADWLIAGAISGVICAPLVLLGRHGSAQRRAVMLSAATGILFALAAGLTKAMVDELHHGLPHVIASWEPYALAVVGYASMTLNQMALNTGALAPAVATSAALDPIASVVLGLTVFHESIHAGVGRSAVTIVALGVALGGVTLLARAEAGT
jgi:drug/metabolite transporter (DMT)-like permease